MPTLAPNLTARELNATRVAGTATELAQAPSAPSVQATPEPTEAPTGTNTPPPTATTFFTPTNTLVAANATPKNSTPVIRLNNLWTTEGLTLLFKDLGAFAAEPSISRPPNVNPLTGLVVDNPALLQRRPILARLGNDAAIRNEHTGFNEADLVFEELIDQKGGGFALTRFTLVFLGNNGTFRPLRSARLVNASLAPMFDAALVSSGGSDKTRWILSQVPWAKVNLDADLNNKLICIIGNDYRSRFASSVEHIHEFLSSKGLDKPVQLRGFQFSSDPPSGRPNSSVAFDKAPWPLASAGAVEWRFDAASGRYLRFINGAPHNTLQYGVTPNWAGQCMKADEKVAQISAANVVILYASHEATDIIEDSLGFTNVYIALTGENRVQILRDGQVIEGKWHRPTLQQFIQFTDTNGKEISLKPGNSWFQIVPTNYSPVFH